MSFARSNAVVRSSSWLSVTLGCVLALLVATTSGAAQAADERVHVVHINGPFVAALFRPVDDPNTTFSVIADRSEHGTSVYVSAETYHLDQDGSFVGLIRTTGEKSSGFTFDFKIPVSSARLVATGIPARTCELDADFREVSCAQAEINDVDVVWTGYGATLTTRQALHTEHDGFHMTFFGFKRYREYTVATGSIEGDEMMPAWSPFEAFMILSHNGLATVCTGHSTCT
jgi:hypothetical protein